MTQLALNSRLSNTIKKSSFFANFEQDLKLFEKKLPHRTAQEVMKRARMLKKMHESILQMQHRSTKHQNKRRKTMPQLKKKNKMYLLTINLKTKRSNKKLDHVKIESFFIKKIKESINYKLQFSSNIKIHSIFHISFLKLIDSTTSIQITFHYESQKKNEFEIEKKY